MPMVIGELLVRIGSDTKGLDQITKRMQDVATKAQQAGQTLSIALTVPLAAVGGAAIKMGTDAVEGENLFTVSMGRMADSARAWSQELRAQLGLNEYELRRQIGTLNVMLGAMGIGEQAAYDMSRGLTELAYDMASFYNLHPDEAFTKLTAAISGESEPLKRLGIVINETTIETWALTNGLIAQGEQLTEQEKIVARYGAIMEQTAVAQGDMARTIDSPANQLRILQERIRQTTTELGVSLLPAYEKVLQATGPLVDKLKEAVDWFGRLNPAMQENILKWIALVAAIGPVSLALSQLLKVGGLMTAAIATTVTAVHNVTYAFAAWAGGAATLSEAISLATGKLAFLFGPAGLVIAAVGAIALWIKHNNDLIESQRRMQAQHEQSVVTLTGLRDRYAEVSDQLSRLKPGTDAHKAAELELQGIMQQMASLVPDVTTATEDLAAAREKNLSILDAEIQKEAAAAAALEKTALLRDQLSKKTQVEFLESERWQAQQRAGGRVDAETQRLADLKAGVEAELVSIAERLDLLDRAMATGDYSALVKKIVEPATTAAAKAAQAASAAISSVAAASTRNPEVVWRGIIDALRQAQREMAEGTYIDMRLAAARGESFDWRAEQAALIEDTIRALYREGMSPEHNSIQWLLKELQALLAGAPGGAATAAGGVASASMAGIWNLAQMEREYEAEVQVAKEAYYQLDLRAIRDHAMMERQYEAEITAAKEANYQLSLDAIRSHAEMERAYEAEVQAVREATYQFNIRALREHSEMERAYEAGIQAAREANYQLSIRAVRDHALMEREYEAQIVAAREAVYQANVDAIRDHAEMERAYEAGVRAARELNYQLSIAAIRDHSEMERAYEAGVRTARELNYQLSIAAVRDHSEMERAYEQKVRTARELYYQLGIAAIGDHAAMERQYEAEVQAAREAVYQADIRALWEHAAMERAYEAEVRAAAEARYQADLRAIWDHSAMERAYEAEMLAARELNYQLSIDAIREHSERERAYEREVQAAREAMYQVNLRAVAEHAAMERAYEQEVRAAKELNYQLSLAAVRDHAAMERAYEQEIRTARELNYQIDLAAVRRHSEMERAYEAEIRSAKELYYQLDLAAVREHSERERAYEAGVQVAREANYQASIDAIADHAAMERDFEAQVRSARELNYQLALDAIAEHSAMERAYEEQVRVARDAVYQANIRALWNHAAMERAYEAEVRTATEANYQLNLDAIREHAAMERAYEAEVRTAKERNYQANLAAIREHAAMERAYEAEIRTAKELYYQLDLARVREHSERERAYEAEVQTARDLYYQLDLRRVWDHAMMERQYQNEVEAAREAVYQNDLRGIWAHAERERAYQREQERVMITSTEMWMNVGRRIIARLRESLPIVDNFLSNFEKFTPGLYDKLKSAVMDSLRNSGGLKGAWNAGQAALQAAPGGPEAMAAAVLMTLISESETFRRIVEAINPILQAAADAVGALIQPILPLINVVSSTLVPLFAAMGEVLGSLLLPVMQALFPVFRILGMAVIRVAQGFAWAWNTLAKVINAALGWLGVNIKLIDTEALQNAFEHLQSLTWEQAMATEAATNAMYNVPHGFKVALRRFESATAEPWSPGGISRDGVTPATGAASGGLTVILQGDIYGYEDFERKVAEAQARRGRAMRLSTAGTV